MSNLIDDIIIGAYVPKENKVFEFVSNANKQFIKQHLVNTGIIKTYIKDDGILTVLFLRPVIKTKTIFLYISAIVSLIAMFFNFLWLLYIPLALGLISFLQSNLFIYFLFCKGLRKIGVTGKIQRVKINEIVREMIL